MPKKIDWAKEAAENQGKVELSTNKYLKKISEAVKKAEGLTKEIAATEAALNDLKKKLEEQVRQVLPDMFLEAGLTGLTTEQGHKVEIKKMVTASITNERREEALAWLRENGYEDMIKANVVVDFKKGEEKQRGVLVTTLVKKGYTFEEKDTVHPQTLKSFVSSMLEKGDPVPEKTFGVYTFSQAQIKYNFSK